MFTNKKLPYVSSVEVIYLWRYLHRKILFKVIQLFWTYHKRSLVLNLFNWCLVTCHHFLQKFVILEGPKHIINLLVSFLLHPVSFPLALFPCKRLTTLNQLFECRYGVPIFLLLKVVFKPLDPPLCHLNCRCELFISFLYEALSIYSFCIVRAFDQSLIVPLVSLLEVVHFEVTRTNIVRKLRLQ